MSQNPAEKPDAALMTLVETLAGIQFDIHRIRDFLGRKVAREVMDELNLSGQLDEVGEAALQDFMGTAAVSGIVLSLRGTTEPKDIGKEVRRLQDSVEEDFLKYLAEKLAPLMILRGIDFHRNELVQRTPKAVQWLEEFELLKTTDPS